MGLTAAFGWGFPLPSRSTLPRHFWAILTPCRMPLLAPPPQAAVACSQAPLRFGRLRRRRFAPLPARWCGRQRCDCHASIHAGMTTADPLPGGGSLRSRPLFVPAHFAPCSCGGRNGPVCLSGSGYAAFIGLSPSAPAGNGRERRRRVRGLGNGSRWESRSPCPMPLPRLQRPPLPRHGRIRHNAASDR